MLTPIEFYSDFMDDLFEGVYVVDRHRKILFWNKGAERISGYTKDEAVGKRCSDNLLVHVDRSGTSLCGSGCPLFRAMEEAGRVEDRVFLHHKHGHRIPVLVRITPIRGETGEIIGAVEIFHDNRAKIATAEEMSELSRLALLDPLTELPNRRFGEAAIAARLAEMKNFGAPFGLLFADIDHFKQVNDGFGHEAGDLVLKMVARTLFINLRSRDQLFRWGGEEFLAILACENASGLLEVANKLRMLVEKSSMFTDSGIVRVTVSIGAALALEEDTVDALVRRADALMYQSKRRGRNSVTAG